MTVTRPFALGGSILAFVLAVAWMIPPTTPKATEAGPTIPHRAAAFPATPTLTPPVDASFAVPPPSFPPASEVTLDRGVRPAFPSHSPSDSYRDSPPPPLEDDRYAYLDPQEEYDRGYRWAKRRQAEDPRECRRWAGTLVEDGCLGFLQDKSEESDEPEAPDDE